MLVMAAVVAACCSPVALMPTSSDAQNLPNLGDTEREELSPTMERKLGEQIMHDIRRDRDYLDDEAVSEYMNNFGQALVSARPESRGEAGFDFFFFVVRDPQMNAFALPGGFIGVHSALIMAAQNENELASVMAHEIGHVAQRHIARMLGAQKQDMLIPLASLLLAVLAARSNSDMSAAALMSGQGIALQRQLSFSRNAEREADRVGFQILSAAGFDTMGMVTFFGRLQNSTRLYTEAPAFLQNHPLTSERIADMQARARTQRYRQHADSLDFHLIQARLHVLQDLSPQGMRDAETWFENQLRLKSKTETIAAKYGLAYVALRRGQFPKAQSLLQEAYAAAAPASATLKSLTLTLFSIDLKLAANQNAEALKEAEAAREQFPISRGIVWQYADALIALGRTDDAVRFLRDQTQMYRNEPELQERLARAYAAQGKQALQHLALAESYAVSGSLLEALDQLGIARRAPDASFYDQSIIDAREREWKERWKEESKDQKQR
jgi:predicted Zn-dependent protease